jgi:hypothetical protein
MNKVQEAHITLSRIIGYFCRKGKIENIESNLFKIFINNSKKKESFK